MDSRYSFSLTTFSPVGKLGQIEHAVQAVSAGSTALGIKTKFGAVLATEKKLEPLIDETSIEKIYMITDNIGCVYAGMGPDSRVLVRKGRKVAEQYFRTYHDPIPVNQLVAEMASVMQEYTQSGGVRPFGVSLLIAGVDEEGTHLYQVDPSGSFWLWKASAIGKGMINARTFLEKRYNENLGLDDAIHMAILGLKEGFEGEMNETNIEIGLAQEENGKRVFRVLKPEEIQYYLKLET
eukprot:TRINITY_DN360_c0_g1_i1.p2 TRINITY_DN360_c0_g1~~TRINITY_DN360_c0_g1_i1.p2  ORF type:complete len:237 (-),score=71.66 TRINITY_DN360_c0_g1_i1:68-778(-)